MPEHMLFRLLNIRNQLPKTFLQIKRNMATSTHIELSTPEAGVFHVPDVKGVSARKASEVLQRNHDNFHCFFNTDGFHNHISHHILTIYSLGAGPQEIQTAYDRNAGYQRTRGSQREQVIKDLHDREQFLKYLGKEQYYIDFLQFFQSEIEKKSIAKTFLEQIFGGDEAAERMRSQLFAGFLHPIIHTGFGIEFNQPAIVAEGLAMCAVSSSWMNRYFDLIHERINSDSTAATKSLFSLLEDIQSNDKLAHCARWEDPNKIRDGVLARAPTEMVSIASQWRVSRNDPADIEEKTAEMTNFSAYFTGAAQNPKKQVKMDFYFMHCINASIFFLSLIQKPWLTNDQKAKLIEMKGWVDLALYVSRNSPRLYIDEIRDYKPRGTKGDWNDVIGRVNKFDDDGHASKFIRALASGERLCKPYDEKEDWPVKGDMWLKLANMVIDSVEAGGSHWGRSVGFPEAWVNFADRK